MCRSRFDLHHLGTHRHILCMNAQGVVSTGQCGPSCAGCLIAREDDHVSVVPRILSQVVQNSPPCGHAAGRQDHHRAMPSGQRFRLLGRFKHGGHPVHSVHFLLAQAMFPNMVLIQSSGVDGHGAVQKDGQTARNGPGRFQLGNGV